MEHHSQTNDSSESRRILEGQLRECFGRVVYSHKTHEKYVDILLSRLSTIKLWQIILSAIATGGFIAPVFGAHVGLTGGCLYKEGEPKDIDIIIYRIRQREEIDWEGLTEALKLIDLTINENFGFCRKAVWGKLDNWAPVDILFPEEDGDYE